MKCISALLVNLRECYSEITKTSEQINMAVREEYITRTELETIRRDFETSITQNSTEIRMDFTQVTDSIKGDVAVNQQLLEEYIRFRGALIELGKVGNAFTAELSNEELAFKENGRKSPTFPTRYSSSRMPRYAINCLWETRAEGGCFIPRTNGNLSIKWRGPTS